MAVKVVNNTLKVKAELLKNINKGLEAVGLYAEGEVKRRAPVDTGDLRSSVASEVYPDKVRIGSDKNYAVYVEMGTGLYAEEGNGRKTPWVYEGRDGKMYQTKGQKPQPYLRSGIEENINQIVTIFENNVKMR
jgi:HK97 gp10 family phage protein